MSNIVSLDAARYYAVFLVDTSEELASLASKASDHQDFSSVLAVYTEWAWSGVLKVPTDKFIDVVFWIFHCLLVYIV